MKAAVWHGDRDVRIEDAAVPEIGDGEVLIRVKAAGICGSDVNVYLGLYRGTTTGPPAIFGHEFSGEVARIGNGVKRVKIGDRVAVNPLIACGECELCMRGLRHLCKNRTVIGAHLPGALAEFVRVPADRCFVLPDTVAYEHGAMVEPLSVAVHAVSRTVIRPRDTVVVLGTGTIGLLALQVIKLQGARRVFATDISNSRLDLARKLGADVVVNSKETDPIKRIYDLTDNLGVDFAFEVVGTQQTIPQALKLVRQAGEVVIVGTKEPSVQLETADIPMKELTVGGIYGYRDQDIMTSISLISEMRVDVGALQPAIFQLNDAKSAFEAMARQETIKSIVIP